MDKFLGGYSLHSTPSNSPLLNRHHKIVSNPSTDSAIHSVYTHRYNIWNHTPYFATKLNQLCIVFTAVLQRVPEPRDMLNILRRCLATTAMLRIHHATRTVLNSARLIHQFKLIFFFTISFILFSWLFMSLIWLQSRHPIPSHPAAHHLFRSEHGAFARQTSTTTSSGPLEGCIEGGAGSPDPEGSDDRMHHHQGVSRQQLINRYTFYHFLTSHQSQ